jgi:hypothetical protein
MLVGVAAKITALSILVRLKLVRLKFARRSGDR